MPRAAALLVPLALALGCGGGPPRKPTPPSQREATSARARVDIRGTRDAWDDTLVVTDGLKRVGGVKDCYRDEADGLFVIVYDPRRVHRDELHQHIVELGRDQGRTFEPLFEDR